MTQVLPTIAEWLKTGYLTHAASAPLVAQAWGDLSNDSEISAPYANRGDAQIEGTAQIGFLGQPMAQEQLRVPGRRVDLVGQARRIVADRVGYGTGILVFILGAQEENDNSTLLTVLRPMSGGAQ